MQQEKQRDYLFDNFKAILIILVVLGHFLEPNYRNNPMLFELKWAIFSVHMPAFIFVSGYFSKKKASFEKLIKGIAIPYVVYELAYYVLYHMIGKETTFSLHRPKFSLWYLMGLFIWKLVTPYFSKIPGCVVLAMIAGLLIGLTDYDNFFSIPRIVYFFPFFLAGMRFERSMLNRLRCKACKVVAAIVLVAGMLYLCLDQIHRSMPVQIFYGRYSYEVMGQSAFCGMLIRLLCYVISFVLTYAIIIWIPQKQTMLSYMGQRTMAIYIFHGLLYSAVHFKLSMLSAVDTNAEAALLITGCIALTFVLSAKPFTMITDLVASVPIEKLTRITHDSKNRE